MPWKTSLSLPLPSSIAANLIMSGADATVMPLLWATMRAGKSAADVAASAAVRKAGSK